MDERATNQSHPGVLARREDMSTLSVYIHWIEELEEKENST